MPPTHAPSRLGEIGHSHTHRREPGGQEVGGAAQAPPCILSRTPLPRPCHCLSRVQSQGQGRLLPPPLAFLLP